LSSLSSLHTHTAMSFMTGLKESSLKAKDATERMAKQTKLKGEIMLAERNMTSIKKAFGEEIYGAMVASDRARTEALFNTTRQRIEALEAEVASKRAQIAALKTQGGPGEGSTTNSVGPPVGPPPGPPPSGPALPEGWKRAATPEGKEYFYHETTGETSWTPPQ